MKIEKIINLINSKIAIEGIFSEKPTSDTNKKFLDQLLLSPISKDLKRAITDKKSKDLKEAITDKTLQDQVLSSEERRDSLIKLKEYQTITENLNEAIKSSTIDDLLTLNIRSANDIIRSTNLVLQHNLQTSELFQDVAIYKLFAAACINKLNAGKNLTPSSENHEKGQKDIYHFTNALDVISKKDPKWLLELIKKNRGDNVSRAFKSYSNLYQEMFSPQRDNSKLARALIKQTLDKPALYTLISEQDNGIKEAISAQLEQNKTRTIPNSAAREINSLSKQMQGFVSAANNQRYGSNTTAKGQKVSSKRKQDPRQI